MQSRIFPFSMIVSMALPVLFLSQSCKKRSEQSLIKTNENSIDEEMKQFEVVDCTPEICKNGKKLIAVIQDYSDQSIAMEMRQSSEGFALDSNSTGAATKSENSPGAKLLQRHLL